MKSGARWTLSGLIACVWALLVAGCAVGVPEDRGPGGGGSGGGAGGGGAPGAGGSGTGGSSGGGPTAPPFVSVHLVGALLRPWNADNTEWDGPGSAAAEKVQQLADLLGDGAPEAEIAAWILNLGIDATALPDVIGTAYFYVGGERQDLPASAEDSNTENTCGAAFELHPHWDHVVLDEKLRFGLELQDEDLAFDDTVGSVELGYKDAVNALQAGTILKIPTSEQDQQTILFVSLSVVPE